jgi:hypothetical protein
MHINQHGRIFCDLLLFLYQLERGRKKTGFAAKAKPVRFGVELYQAISAVATTP